MQILTDAELAAKIKDECESGDIENDHWNADNLITIQLEALGYKEAIVAWNNVRKWYA